MKDLEAQLGQLEYVELIRSVLEEEPTYIFKHALVQDTAYGSLLKQDRKILHRRVGEALERAYAGQLEEVAALLAKHYFEAGDDGKTLHFSTLAGDGAMRTFADPEALAHYELALATIRRAEESSASLPGPEITHAFKSYGRAQELASRYHEAAEVYQELETLARKHQDRAMELAALLERAKIYGTINSEHDPAQGKLLSERALEIAREIGDRASECQVLWNLQITANYSPSDSHDAVAYGEQAVAIARSLNLRDQLAYVLADLACSCWGTGELDKGQTVLIESRKMWLESGNLPMLSQNDCSASITAFLRGEYDEAIKFADEGDEVSRSSGNLWGLTHSHYVDGYVRFLRGESDAAFRVLTETVKVGEQVGHPVGTIIVRGELAWALGVTGELEKGIAVASAAQELADKHLPSLRAFGLAVRSRLEVLQGDWPSGLQTVDLAKKSLQREAWIPLNPIWVALASIEAALASGENARAIRESDELLKELHDLHIQAFTAEALLLRGIAHAQDKQIEQMEGDFTQSLEIAHRLGERYTEWHVLKSWSERARDPKQAEELRRAAEAAYKPQAGHTA